MFEQWDDGPRSGGDGWSSTCEIESGYSCVHEVGGSYCYIPNWGDTKKTPDEEWEDNNNVDDDGCTNCLINRGYSWEGGDRDSPDTSCEIRWGDGVMLEIDPKLWDDNNTIR